AAGRVVRHGAVVDAGVGAGTEHGAAGDVDRGAVGAGRDGDREVVAVLGSVEAVNPPSRARVGVVGQRDVVEVAARAGALAGDEDPAVGADGDRPAVVVTGSRAVVAGRPALPSARGVVGHGGGVEAVAVAALAGDVHPTRAGGDRERPRVGA